MSKAGLNTRGFEPHLGRMLLRPITRHALRWSGIYLLCALLPLLLALASRPDSGRGFGLEFGHTLGLVALGVFGMQIVISGRHRWFARDMGMDNKLQFHRELGVFALLLVLLHPLVMMVSEPAHLSYLNPAQDTLRALMLWLLLIAAVVLVSSSLWRKRFGLDYERWRLLHGGLTLFLVLGGLGHALMAGHYTGGMDTAALMITLFVVPVALLIDSRLLRLMRMRDYPWSVVEVRRERGDATTLVLAPEGDHQLDFAPGQFIWITLGNTPFSLQQHPFSLASSADQPRRIAFTAKNLGDFTSTLPDVEPGTRAWVEGPYGAFLPAAVDRSGAVLFAGGIGITPIMSILRSFRDREVDVPLWLVYANQHWEEVTFREEIDALARELPLEVIHVLADPPEHWSGEQGYVDAELIRRCLPADDGNREYFICGPAPMMNAIEPALVDEGVPVTRIFSDRFDLV